MHPLGSAGKAMAIFFARIAISRFMRLLTAQPITPADVHNLTPPDYRECLALFFNEPKTHEFYFEKNWGLFKHIPLLLERSVLAPKPFALPGKLAILGRYHICVAVRGHPLVQLRKPIATPKSSAT